MTGQEPFDSQDPQPAEGTTPPLQPLPYRPVEPVRTVWPTVLGIIGIIFGAFGILSGLWAGVAEMVPALHQAAASQPTPISGTYAMITGLVNIALAVLLLVGGITLIGRRALAVTLLKTWAIVDIITAIGGFVFVLAGMSQMVQTMQQQNPAMAKAPPAVLEAAIIGGICIGGLFALALPIFTLIWFGRQKIKDEIAAWA